MSREWPLMEIQNKNNSRIMSSTLPILLTPKISSGDRTRRWFLSLRVLCMSLYLRNMSKCWKEKWEFQSRLTFWCTFWANLSKLMILNKFMTTNYLSSCRSLLWYHWSEINYRNVNSSNEELSKLLWLDMSYYIIKIII